MTEEPKSNWRFRPRMELIYTLQPGEQYKFYDGRIVVVHPDRPPKIVTAMGVFEITPHHH